MTSLIIEKKAELIEALRSGHYQQYNKGYVADRRDNPTAFCCIGAMAKHIHQFSYSTSECGNALGLTWPSATHENFFGLLPNKLALEFLVSKGLYDDTQEIPAWWGLIDVLIHLNDKRKWDFNQIADFLEVAL